MFTFYFRRTRSYFSFTALPHHDNGRGWDNQALRAACSGPNPAHASHGTGPPLTRVGPHGSEDAVWVRSEVREQSRTRYPAFYRVPRRLKRAKQNLDSVQQGQISTQARSCSRPLPPQAPEQSLLSPDPWHLPVCSHPLQPGWGLHLHQFTNISIYLYSPYTKSRSSNASVQLLAKLHVLKYLSVNNHHCFSDYR